MSLLLPEGITHLSDVPYTFWDALRMGLGFLRWDELPKEEKPPRKIWLDGDALRDHFRHVERMREERMRGGSEEDPGGYTENAAARDLIR